MWPRSLVGRRPTDICEARVRIPSKCESYQAFFSAIAFTATFLQISYLKFYNYGNLISRVLNFAIVVRRYFAGLHIRDFNARPALLKRRHAMRAKFFFWLGWDRTIWVTCFFNFVKEKEHQLSKFQTKILSNGKQMRPFYFLWNKHRHTYFVICCHCYLNNFKVAGNSFPRRLLTTFKALKNRLSFFAVKPIFARRDQRIDVWDSGRCMTTATIMLMLWRIPVNQFLRTVSKIYR